MAILSCCSLYRICVARGSDLGIVADLVCCVLHIGNNLMGILWGLTIGIIIGAMWATWWWLG